MVKRTRSDDFLPVEETNRDLMERDDVLLGCVVRLLHRGRLHFYPRGPDLTDHYSVQEIRNELPDVSIINRRLFRNSQVSDGNRQQRRGTRGKPPDKTQSVAEAIKDDIRTKHFTMREGRLFDGRRKVVQKVLMHRYHCGKSTLLDALGIVRSELKTPTNSDKK
jgi:hypothetical protein